ncbi:aldehyde dehydrogenase [Fragilariopsis cylindrus CCMP1102]|uniref:Aldehyde dehydrogenase n=1 Tax=Fragilariopsis cylindrus CCMP1102 TaxID=635003 RepID=A0A1E7ETK9_9STRA|nr:aldehyde dehydrogenase [Fragilariopsis cylindrus CCMP1102]|eukprot:OEU09124.1 aldehyde dehydrogenase [Fragilariopsis cylindrus CCMP1102]
MSYIRSYDKQYIHGQWIHSTRKQNNEDDDDSSTLNVIDSNTSNIIATIPNGTKQDTIKAITAANTALPKWRATPLKIRLNYIRTFLEKIECHREEINNRLIVELGCTKTFANDAQLGSLIGHTITLLNLLDTDNENGNNGNGGDESKFQWEYAAGKCTVVKEPIGVVGCITPWNYPLNQIALKVIPALLAGCTVVLKPSEITPLCAYSVCEAFHDSELPKGVFNMVMGKGPECGEILASHENVNLVSFTGSTSAGQILTKVAAESGTMKPIKTELGGKSASLLLHDANFDKVVPVYVKQLTSNTGQSCNALSRMIVPRSSYQKVVELCIQTMKTEIIGDSRYNSKATIGPLVSQKQYESVISLITSGIQDDGATLLYGGLEKPSTILESKENKNGYFVQPTLFGDVTNKMIIARTEIFGPVLCLIPYDTVEEGIEIANDTPYGLNNAVASNDIKKAVQVAAQLQSGMVMVNHTNLDLKAPFGGYKLSGNAREWGESGLDEFLITKMINMDINEYRKNK